jgi:hypothetical protein
MEFAKLSLSILFVVAVIFTALCGFINWSV